MKEGGHSGHRFWAQLLTPIHAQLCFLLIQNLQDKTLLGPKLNQMACMLCNMGVFTTESENNFAPISPQPKTIETDATEKLLVSTILFYRTSCHWHSPHEETRCSIVKITNLISSLKMTTAQDR